MSDPVTALGGVRDAGGIASVAEVPLQGMITLRANLSEPKVGKAVKSALKADVPGPRSARIADDQGVAWMSPDELLILCPYSTSQATVDKLNTAFKGIHALVVNVSDARASFRVSGPHAQDVLAKLCPVDFTPDAFGPDAFRRTRMAQVPAAVWQCGQDAFQIICFRSQARYLFDLLTVAAQPGSEVFRR